MDIYLSNLLQTVIEFFFYNFMNSCFNFGDIILCNLLKTPQERDFLWHMVVILREISKEQITEISSRRKPNIVQEFLETVCKRLER